MRKKKGEQSKLLEALFRRGKKVGARIHYERMKSEQGTSRVIHSFTPATGQAGKTARGESEIPALPCVWGSMLSAGMTALRSVYQ